MTNENNAPLVSVIMSVYNGEKYLEGCIESILKQTFQDFEFIIINDCSTDMTADILHGFEEDRRFIIIHNSENIGLTKSLNKALSLARSSYIARMDVDDLSLPDRLDTQYRFMKKNTEVGVVGSSYYEINEEGAVIGEVILPEKDGDIRAKILRLNPFNHSAVMVRKSALNDSGAYNEKFVYSQDYELWFRILRKHKGYNIQEKLIMKRNPAGSVTVSKKRKQIGFTIRAVNSGKKYFKAAIKDEIQQFKYYMIFITPQTLLNIMRCLRDRFRNKNYYIVRF